MSDYTHPPPGMDDAEHSAWQQLSPEVQEAVYRLWHHGWGDWREVLQHIAMGQTAPEEAKAEILENTRHLWAVLAALHTGEPLPPYPYAKVPCG